MMDENTLWENSQSYVSEKDGHFEGVLDYLSATFELTLHPQTSGKYPLRGTVKVISHETGKILRGRAENASSVTKNIASEIVCNQMSMEAVKSAFIKKAKKMYRDYASVILRDIQQSVRPDSITACAAAMLYADQYIRKRSQKRELKENTQKDYKKRIQEFFAFFPTTVPMCELSARQIAGILKEGKVSNKNLEIANAFWDYLLQKGHVTGDNCLPQLPKKNPSSSKKQEAIDMVRELDLTQQDKLFNLIMKKDNLHGGDCGVALMAWGGFEIADGKKWRDLVVLDANSGKAVMLNYRGDIAGATHDFSRPLFPQAALILLRAREKLRLKYSEEKLSTMPIIGLLGNPEKPMGSQNLNGYAKKLLLQIGIPEKSFPRKNASRLSVPKTILLTTYQKNLYYRTGLGEDEGVMNFMQGLSLRGNVTNDNYTSFTSPDAVDRIFTALKAIRPNEFTGLPEVTEKVDGENYQNTFSPEREREHIGGVFDAVLAPGQKLCLIAEHGVYATVRAREVLEDGSIRRKSRKKAV